LNFQAQTAQQDSLLEFLDLREDERYTESDLENAIINKIEHFMFELGKRFYLKAGKSDSHLMATAFLLTGYYTTVCFFDCIAL